MNPQLPASTPAVYKALCDHRQRAQAELGACPWLNLKSAGVSDLLLRVEYLRLRRIFQGWRALHAVAELLVNKEPFEVVAREWASRDDET